MKRRIPLPRLLQSIRVALSDRSIDLSNLGIPREPPTPWSDRLRLALAELLDECTDACRADLIMWAMFRHEDIPLWRELWWLIRYRLDSGSPLADALMSGSSCQVEGACSSCYCGKYATDHHFNRFRTQTTIPKEDQPF